MDDNGRCTCCVCRDEIANPRILPCWHAACFTCILGLTQNGQGRAVSCPVCTQTSPFETVRSLPTPVKCVVCQHFVTNPQKFPCCNGLCCYDCIQRYEYIGGIACGNNCRPEAKYTLQNLFPARICPQCYSLHLGQARNCGHFICKRCNPDTLEAPRPCYVCQLASSPAPRPANPFAAAILPTQGIQPVDRNMIQQNLQQAGLKAIAFWILMLVMISTYGFCVWTWIVGLLALLAFRLDFKLALGTCAILRFVIFVCSFYYFYHAVSLFLLTFLSQRYLPRLHPKAPVVFEAISLCILFPYYEPIFLHKFLLELVIAIMAGF